MVIVNKIRKCFKEVDVYYSNNKMEDTWNGEDTYHVIGFDKIGIWRLKKVKY